MAVALGRRGDLFMGAYEWFARRAAITSGSRRAGRFGSFGDNSVICFPPAALFGEHAIHIGERTLIGPHVSLSAGMAPEQRLIGDRIVAIGSGVLIGRGSSVVGHLEIVIEDDVFFGPNVYVTDQNHGFEDPEVPIGRQSMSEKPVRIGWGSWVGTNSVVVPGVTIGRHVAVGAGSVVTSDLPDNCVAVGSPARIIRSAGPSAPLEAEEAD
ncbi:MAG: acyltransferase [Acidimicrobiales bacterium]